MYNPFETMQKVDYYIMLAAFGIVLIVLGIFIGAGIMKYEIKQDWREHAEKHCFSSGKDLYYSKLEDFSWACTQD